MNRKILSKRVLSLQEARDALKKRVSGSESLSSIQERTWSYLSTFAQGSSEEARKAVESLVKLGLALEVAVNLVNVCPGSEGEVRSILAMQKELAYDRELVGKILKTLSGACSR